jgi:hypothetical protein
MENVRSHQQAEPPSEKSFASIFSALLFLLAVYLGIVGSTAYFVLIVPAVFLFIIGYVRPSWLILPNRLWFRFGLLLQRLVSSLLLALFYLLAIVPTGLLLRLCRKDILHLSIDRKARSYWIERPKADNSMENQF